MNGLMAFLLSFCFCFSNQWHPVSWISDASDSTSCVFAKSLSLTLRCLIQFSSFANAVSASSLFCDFVSQCHCFENCTTLSPSHTHTYTHTHTHRAHTKFFEFLIPKFFKNSIPQSPAHICFF